MRKILAVTAVLAFMMCAGLPSRAQEATSETIANANAHRQPDRPVHAYRLDFSVNELEDGKKINTRQYSLNLNADDANEIKIGTRVPVEAEHESFQYMDVGTSIWCIIRERADSIPLSVRADISNFAVPDQASGHESRPIVRQFKINASTLAQVGKLMVVGSVDDPNSKRQFQLEVTVSKVK
jgi:3D (Asp-Asp-Asp) domain-containing protein